VASRSGQKRQTTPERQTGRGRRTDQDVADAIRRALVLQPDTPAAVLHRHLMQRPDFVGRVPEERTIRHLVRQWREEHASASEEPWTLLEDPDGNARYVLPALREARLRDATTRISKTRASWIARVQRAAPEADPMEVYLLAAEYEAADASKDRERAQWLDSRLALLTKRGVTYRFTKSGQIEVVQDDEGGSPQ
jgi:hypothetical protein